MQACICNLNSFGAIAKSETPINVKDTDLSSMTFIFTCKRMPKMKHLDAAVMKKI